MCYSFCGIPSVLFCRKIRLSVHNQQICCSSKWIMIFFLYLFYSYLHIKPVSPISIKKYTSHFPITSFHPHVLGELDFWFSETCNQNYFSLFMGIRKKSLSTDFWHCWDILSQPVQTGVGNINQHSSFLWVCTVWELLQLGVGSADCHVLVMAERRGLSYLSWHVMLPFFSCCWNQHLGEWLFLQCTTAWWFKNPRYWSHLRSDERDWG